MNDVVTNNSWDSWDAAAQDVLDIHRLGCYTGTGTREVRPRSTTLRPHSEARARPASAPPPARVKRRSPSSASKRNHPAVLIPSLPNTSIVGKVSRAELEAWATLRSITEEEPHVRSARRHRESRPMVVTFDRARPNSTSEQYSSYDRTDGAPFDRQRPTKVVKKPRGFDVFCVEQLDGCTPTCAEHDALRQRQKERDRSDISVRYLREHARKTMKEEKAFLRLLRAEAKVEKDGQIEMIRRATQWSRDMNKGIVYLPHGMGGKLCVLKIRNAFAAARPDEAGRCGGGASKGLKDNERVISVDSFVKGDFARLRREHYNNTHGGVVGNTDGVAATSTKLKEPTKIKRKTSCKCVRGRPNAVDTCRELHQLIRDTVGLVDVLTRQSIELEGQGWNRQPGGDQDARQRGTRR